jgi:hypothetical protein
MKSPLSKTLFFLPLLFCRLIAAAQVFSNDDAAREALFVTRVVQLDEFIHRFNNDSSSEIRRYYLSRHRSWDKSREQLIRSLFNYTTKRWDSLQLNRFIQCATDPQQPDLLAFMGDRWYAEAVCNFLYRDVPVKANLILRLQVNPDGSAQWVIAAVKPWFGMKKPMKSIIQARKPGMADQASIGSHQPPLPVAVEVTTVVSRKPVVPVKRFIQPAANETNFAELERDFADKRRLAELFEPDFFDRHFSQAFFQALLIDRLRFVSVRKLRYHYLQVHDWIFTVENFERSTRNSGWLISGIRQAGAEERSNYVKSLLEE